MGAMKQGQVRQQDGKITAPRLGDLLTDNLGVFCWCNRCGHNAIVSSEALARRMGPDVPVPEVGSRMRCSACDSKNVATRPAWPQRGTIARHDRPATTEASPPNRTDKSRVGGREDKASAAVTGGQASGTDG